MFGKHELCLELLTVLCLFFSDVLNIFDRFLSEKMLTGHIGMVKPSDRTTTTAASLPVSTPKDRRMFSSTGQPLTNLVSGRICSDFFCIISLSCLLA